MRLKNILDFRFSNQLPTKPGFGIELDDVKI